MLHSTIFVFLCGISLSLGGNLLEEATALGATSAIDLLKKVGLDSTLQTDYLTLFIPSNDAFANMPDELAKTVSGNDTILKSVLQFHASTGIFRSQDAVDNMLVKSTLGLDIRVNTYNDANNAMFVTLNGAKVLKANIQASNGIVHVIDRVMIPPLGTLYDLVSMSEVHKTLKALIDGAGYKSLLETTTGTLFAPTDDAFEEVLARAKAAGVTPDFTGLLARESVLYHILPNVVYSAGANNGTYITMDKGEKLSVMIAANGTAMIDDATVIGGDISATNGVIHILNKVLVPKAYRMDPVIG